MTRHHIILYILLAAVVIACPSTGLADEPVNLEGKYLIQGWNPGNPPEGPPDYTGSARLERWGKTWRYHGVMDDMTYAGAGLYDAECNTLSLSFINGDGSERGVTLLRQTEQGFKGVWAMGIGGKGELGSEIWIKKK